MPEAPETIQAVLFDLDGVLLDAVELHFEALNAALVEHGFPAITRHEQETTYNGLPTRVKLRMLKVPDEKVEPINATKQVATTRLLHERIRVDTRLVAVLQGLRDRKYRMGCCSNSVRSTVDGALLCLGVLPFMEFSLSNEDVKYAKPHPEIYTTACSKLGFDPWRVLVVEDNVNGQRACLDAGCRLCVVRNPADVTLDRIMSSIAEHEALGYMRPPPPAKNPTFGATR